MPDFYLGQDYTRRQISLRVGGSLQNALPTKDKRVVAVCVHADGRNPDAPEVILCGKTQQVSTAGQWLSRQPDPVGVFVFHARNQWEYRGQFVVESSHTQGSQFNKWASRGSRALTDISRVIIFRSVPQA